MLIDDVNIRVNAGHGGKGAAAFNKTKMSLGPVGGSGGDGGGIYLEGVANISALKRFRHEKAVSAENGHDGRGQFVDGRMGKDVVLLVPVGTVVHDLKRKAAQEIIKIGERLLVASGGKGGRGNFHFRSSTNTSPKQFEEGKPGESVALRLELKLIADVGFIGLPNVGKSTLLNLLTNAKAKVANYAFTTLEPNLGAYYELILADIPGLIEGASEGKGLGMKFLRHVERTRVLLHCVAADSEDVADDYQTVRSELKAYNLELLKKPEYVFLTRSDNVSADELVEKIAEMKKIKISAEPISAYDDGSLKALKNVLSRIAKEKHV
jgi:GTP-binding protein